MKISFYNYKFLYLNNQKTYLRRIDRNLMTGEFILGKELERFEEKLSKYLNVKYCLGTSSATSAMEIGLISIPKYNKTEIILPAHTFVATIDAIYNAGFKPIVADIDYSGMINCEKLEKLISKKTFGILAVNINGNSCNYDFLKAISKKYDLHIFEDNAQAFGTKYKNNFTGGIGLFGALSFYPTKILGCFGDGGAIVTNNYSIYKNAKRIRNHGRNNKGNVDQWGTNSRLDNIQAAILNYNLTNIEQTIKKRIAIAKLYFKLLRKNNNIKFTHDINKSLTRNTFQNFEILVKKRNKLKNFLKENGIETLIQWKNVPINKLSLPKFKNSFLKITSNYFKNCLCLPINSSLTEKEIHYICNKINFFYAK